MADIDKIDSAEVLDATLIQKKKAPVVLQSEAMECGLACLSMVMATFGRAIDLTILREKYPTSMRGMSFARLEEIAEEEGFLMTAYHAKAEQMSTLKLPAVLHWKRNHFVVMTEYRLGKGVTLHDPAVGVRRLEWGEFVKDFSEACCEFEALVSMKQETKKERLSIFTLLKQTPGYQGVFLKLGVVALLVELLLLVSPLFLQTVVDEVIPVGDNKLLWALAIGFAGVAGIKSLFGLANNWLEMALSGMLAVSMKQTAFGHLLRLPLIWFEKRGVGAVSARFQSLDNIRTVLANNALTGLIDIFMALVMIAVLLAYEWKLALLTIALTSVGLVLTIWQYQKYALAAAEGISADADEQRILVESITAIPAVKMFGQEMRQLRNYRRAVISSTNRMMDMMRIKTWHEFGQTLINSIGDIAVVGTATYMVLNGSISMGVLFGFYAYKQILTTKLTSLGHAYFQFRVLSVYTGNVADILLSSPEDQDFKPLKVSKKPKLSFRGVYYSYEDAPKPALDEFDLEVRPGEIVGVTGPSGGGKSTLIKLLSGSLRPKRGDILLDSESVVGVPPKKIREHLAVVLQSDHLLTGTILENITMFEGSPDVPRAEQALKDAAVYEEVQELPAGIYSFILGHAPTLSGGQRQRIMLARAFYKNASVLVLDEATSALDVEKEIHVCEAIRKKGLTTLMVAHRQETLARCDRVVKIGG